MYVEQQKYLANLEKIGLPEELEIVPGMEDTHAGLVAFSQKTAAHLLEQYDWNNIPVILSPLNGGLIPSLYLADELNHRFRKGEISHSQYELLTDQIQFCEYNDRWLMTTGKASIADYQPVNVIDDIADRLDSTTKLQEYFPEIIVHAPCQKEDTSQIALGIPRLTLCTSSTVMNKWIMSGYGMDPGKKELYSSNGKQMSQYDVSNFSAHCRSSRVGLYNPTHDGKLPPYEEVFPFLEQNLLPWLYEAQGKNILRTLQIMDHVKGDNTQFQLQLAASCIRSMKEPDFLNGRLLSDFE